MRSGGSTHLARILESVRRSLAQRRERIPFAAILEMAGNNRNRRDLLARIGKGPGIIAEIKRASPSRGWIRKDLDASKTALAYARAGASGISVLTEESNFGGSLRDMTEASAVSGEVPVLRKDFMVDEYMIAEARAFGADAVLLMVSVLGEETGVMLRHAESYRLTPLVEVHDEDEMDVAARCGATLIGINNRDLKTLRVDVENTARLLPLVPHGATVIVESGISDHTQVRRFHRMGAKAFLVGEALVSSREPGEGIRNLLQDISADTA